MRIPQVIIDELAALHAENEALRTRLETVEAEFPEDVMKIAHRLASCTDPEILLGEIARAILADRATQAERMESLKAKLAHYEQHEQKNKRPFSDRHAQQVIANQAKEIERLQTALTKALQEKHSDA